MKPSRQKNKNEGRSSRPKEDVGRPAALVLAVAVLVQVPAPHGRECNSDWCYTVTRI
jgi:hypothetical protein